RRTKIADGSALSGAGKRAAFALFYAPLHFLAVREIVTAVSADTRGVTTLVDVGCGTGAAGAAWASRQPLLERVIGIDSNAWVLGEARETYRAFGVRARTHQADITRAALPSGRAAFIAAFTLNEIADRARDALMARLLERARRGESVLVVEPLA